MPNGISEKLIQQIKKKKELEERDELQAKYAGNTTAPQQSEIEHS